MAPLLAEEVIKHSAYSTVNYNLPATTSGSCTVAQNRRGGPLNIHYEIHGSGPVKLVWVMGLNASLKDWRRQTKYFGHQHASKYSCLVFDNRGVGRSDKPISYYSTSEMARDVVDLVASLGWVDLAAPPERSIHVIGASMGGMIAQEIGMLIPDRLLSLTLCCTAPRLVRTGPFFENLRERAGMFIPRHVDIELERMARSLFPEDFLAEPDTEYEDPAMNFPTKRDRFAAGMLHKRADTEAHTKKGFMMQVLACFRHGEIIREEIGDGIQWKVFEGSGHMLGWEREHELNKMLEEFVDRCT